MSLTGIDPVLAQALAAAGNPRITSGYRSPAYNAKVGGAPGSMHVQGKAVDIDTSGMSDEEKTRLVETLRANGVTRFGTYDNHPNMLHVDLSEANGPFWQMHNRSNRNMAGAPTWFRGLTPTADVRMASADSELPPEMQTPGEPRTGQATMSGSLPPELGNVPFGAQMYQDLMAEQAAQKPSFGERLAADPFFQMGAAILGAPGYGGNFMRAVGQGMSQGIQNAQAAEAARRQTMQNQIRNRLWMEQLNNERFRLLGGEQPTAFEQGQMRYWEGQTANKAKENWLREQGLYEGGGSSGMEPWGILGPDGSVRYESVPKGQVPKTAPDERIFNPRVGKQADSGESGRSAGTSTDAFLTLIEDVESLAAEISSSSGVSPLGTVGDVGAKLSAWSGIADQLLGTKFSDKLKGVFGGADPRVIRGRLQAAVLPVARLLVDPKGPLSGNEQDQAKRLVGVLEGDSVLSGEQAMDLLRQTLRLAKKATGKTPPEMPSGGFPVGGEGLSPEDQTELEMLRKQQGSL